MSDELVHYGVKGMKWGVRKERLQARNARRKQLRADTKTYRRSGGSSKHKADKRRGQDVRDVYARLEADPKYKADFQKLQRNQERRRFVRNTAIGLLVADAALNGGRGTEFVVGSVYKTTKGVKGKAAMRKMYKGLAQTPAMHDGMRKIVKDGVTIFI